jgi:anti-sigma regulatory factor (Ser/Thr protein kinase)
MQEFKRNIIAAVLILNGFFSYSQLDKGLISSYYFSGNANDSIGGIHGTVRGASLSTDRFGNANAAYCFDGVNDYITLGVNSDLKQHVMSISLWAKINDFKSKNKNYPGTPFVYTRVRNTVQYYEAYSIGVYNKNHKISAGNGSPLSQQVGIIAKEPVQIDIWNHVVYMFDSDTTYLYVNGEFQQKNYKGFLSNYLVTDSVVLGFVGNQMPDTFKYHNYSWLNGCLDDIKFYNRILSPSEVKGLFNEPNPKFVGKPDSPKVDLVELLKAFWYLPVLLLIVVLIAWLAIRWRIKYIHKKEKEKNSLQQKFAQMEMMALRSQMNPHFIFNAINSIQHYVLTNEKELANKYLVKFSQLMRNILDLSKQELITLKEELETINLYLDIESLRFNNAFNFSLDVAANVNPNDIKLPPLLIQPFVENAIWHGLLLKEGRKELRISVFLKQQNLVIEIEDNGIGRAAAEKFRNKELKRRSFGMDITNDRLNVLEKVFGIAISFTVVDKMSDAGEPQGTKVIININLEKVVQ